MSVPSNIAEGAARGTRRDFVRFLMMSRGSLSELDTQARIARNLGFYEDIGILAEIESLQVSLGALIKAQQARIPCSQAAKPPTSQAAQRPT